MLNANMINIRNAIACFLPRKPGFDPVEILKLGHHLTPISVVFPRIPIVVLPTITIRIVTVLAPREDKLETKLVGYTSIRILVPSMENLPTQILLSSLTGNSMFMQKLVYVRMPGQCFIVSRKAKGHVL